MIFDVVDVMINFIKYKNCHFDQYGFIMLVQEFQSVSDQY